jgi:AraC family transcriptional regulator
MPSIYAGHLVQLPGHAHMSVAETFIPASAQPLRPHRHELAQLHLVLQGSYVENSRGNNFTLGPGSALFRPANELHSNQFRRATVRGLLIDIDQSATAELLPRIDASQPRYFPAHTFDDLCGSFRLEGTQELSERNTVLHALALALTARISQLSRLCDNEIPAWLSKAVAIVRNRYAEDLRLTALSREIGVPSAFLAKAFRQHLRQSVGGFLMQVRLERARAAIRDSNAPLSDIAICCGFYDQAHLTRAFRRRFGMTPGDLRRLRDESYKSSRDVQDE